MFSALVVASATDAASSEARAYPCVPTNSSHNIGVQASSAFLSYGDIVVSLIER